MEKVLKAWNYLSGKKTVIGAVCKGLADIATALGYVEVSQIIDHIGNFFVVIGLAHKAVK